ncbi:MAG: SMP-30/gluconolactonase/LRE family protein [Planctomycetota bacterium]
MITQASLFHPGPFRLAEGPVLIESSLWWVDIPAGTLHSLSTQSNEHRSWRVSEELSAALPTTDPNRWLVTTTNDIAVFHLETNSLDTLHTPEPKLDTRFNDAKVSPIGSLFAGTMHRDCEQSIAHLYELTPEFELRTCLQGITISNGLGWSPDNSSMYYIDTPTARLEAFDARQPINDSADRRTIFDFANIEGHPDGLTVDADGMIWVALYAGARIVRIDPQQHTIIDQVHVDAPNPTSCTLSHGPNPKLYITTAATAQTPGQIFQATAPSPGLPPTRFAV